MAEFFPNKRPAVEQGNPGFIYTFHQRPRRLVENCQPFYACA
jgi:hypothetical protein